MRKPLAVAGAMILSAATPVFAHQVDEYVQATTISVEQDRVQAQIRLTPGVDVYPTVLAAIDTERVLRDVSLTLDGRLLSMRLVSMQFASSEELSDGRGTIQLSLDAEVPHGGSNRKLVFENHHMARIAAYLVNGLVPRDPDLRITAQNRSFEQSIYQMDYVQSGVASGPMTLAWWSGTFGWLAVAALLLLAPLALMRRRRRAANAVIAS
jgi:hypothetical protein